jgi:hypothetical protein
MKLQKDNKQNLHLFSFNEQGLAALLLIKKLESYYNEKYALSLIKSGKTELNINCYIAGGSAVNFYTGNRGTGDLDFELDKRIELPRLELNFRKNDELLLPKLYIDVNYNPTLGLLYGDYKNDAVFLDVFNEDSIIDLNNANIIKIRPYVFSPEDLIISKLSRWASNDRDDVKELIQLGLVNQDVLEEKIEDALIDYIGLDTFLRYNIKELKDYFLLPKKSLSNDKSNIIISQAIYDEVELQNIFKPQFLNELYVKRYNQNLNCKLQNEFSSVKIENP